ncbi:putative SRP receptor beta subunit [Sodiomyces alkalinus F11]|uniref:Signal recognition particle receptor subunit beta n=1 Tax=Sodiomyces alkalinus (strain CBS 110278 / VKM F-3762 / F11) TaxID=1314773 RepID=A0A3N2PUS9_SODAK|nr:putative SRP receptor beta subunit [Sodiomyces alkalinus F11]ROT38240.1 putative SRP receptor beta subunit [Sodiomyces alkalinus F11]
MAFTDFAEYLLTPTPAVIFGGIFIVLLVPVLLHFLLTANVSSLTNLPTILLVGPSGAGKTALATRMERGPDAQPTETHTTTNNHSIEIETPVPSSSSESPSSSGPSAGEHVKFLLTDTPGHGKLRARVFNRLDAMGENDKGRVRAVVFLCDAAALSDPDSLRHAAAYLHDLLLVLQRRASARIRAGAPLAKCGNPVLVAANKLDLFTALPGTAVKSNLEAEVTRIRASRSKRLLDSGVGADEVGSEAQDDWLGEYASQKFTFEQMGEFGIDIDVIGGNVTGEGPGIEKWWQWMAYRL